MNTNFILFYTYFCRQNFPMIWYVFQPVGFSEASSLKIEMNFSYFFKTQYFGGFWFFLFFKRREKLIYWFGQVFFLIKLFVNVLFYHARTNRKIWMNFSYFLISFQKEEQKFSTRTTVFHKILFSLTIKVA